MAIIGVAILLVTGVVWSRIRRGRTLLAGLAMIVVFCALAGDGTPSAPSSPRNGWGLDDALFVGAALAMIVGALARLGAPVGDPVRVRARPRHRHRPDRQRPLGR